MMRDPETGINNVGIVATSLREETFSVTDNQITKLGDADLTQIDNLITTHWHSDHYGGLAELAGHAQVGQLGALERCACATICTIWANSSLHFQSSGPISGSHSSC